MIEKIVILDFGSQYTQLIARRIREMDVYSEIVPYNKEVELDESVKAIILSGSPFSVTDERALQVDLSKYIGKRPVLGICYGAQYMANALGGKVQRSEKREYGKANLSKVKTNSLLMEGVSFDSQVWMSHGDTITALPDNAELLASTASIDVAAYKINGFDAPVYALQFHPEVTHSLEGKKVLENFVLKIAACQPNWSPASFVEQTVAHLREQLGNDRVIVGLSGGVDSTVAATLLHRAIGKNLFGIFVNNGLLRKEEFAEVLDIYHQLNLNVKGVDAAENFYTALAGTSDPEQKRKIIGRVFIETFDAEAQQIENISWLGQGTIYPDVIESVSVHGPSVTIKSHHNVGGLPEKMNLKIVEPLRMLFKDEVRRVGRELGIPEKILGRHPFPGPGLGIRILGDITAEKVQMLQEADAIFIGKLRKFGLYDQVWQAGAVLLPIKSVGVMGDERTYEQAVALRCVNSIDGMTAEWSRLSYDCLAETSSEIINHVKGINRVVYDISTKPPATIEWE
ncbi:MAG: glutamine-hydrolyzing GMP synthase [Bacteroidota bacterium]